MAKPGVSKKSRQPSKHSRAARRATDVDIDTDKSLKNVKPPSEAVDRPSVLAAKHNSGVSKRTSHRKSQLSAKAKKRNERAMDRAEAIMDRTANKVEKSKKSSRLIQERSKDWDNVNKNSLIQKKFPDEEDLDKEERKQRKQVVAEKEWETDEEMDGADDGDAPAVDAVQAPPPPQNDDFDEEIL
ncbi:hypothetical protein CGCF415_v000097 [Colletotrichum fructicola]|uniref:Microfibril-associated protein n=2 Tax=Colletotrichum gloeosporioides species complex TaxID=2707338 RepID=L2FK02_COLFN|nr:uncharacterized protein CGMCC3_g11319 [Colletotrichum fructicola]KAF4488999.1 hypothetical protein CGGC5_v003266 [Colletotrichum fructicola Nara gc5]KAF4808937.1 hypothetical protein CGCSCA5_v011943 [Colletotrichum siamense]KAF4837751.1 hypothetical protein CGCTS75_v001183 [Colletotrichum tropicale]KAI8156089.1 hypothetical protein K4K50_005917 [Colletotrichum sp. SAR 10_71]KAI8176805.1 hypothetical protein KHU50_003703 [Colletotrichum sp. SAR 10_65]KAI8181206.1 hypothetical protein K4K51_